MPALIPYLTIAVALAIVAVLVYYRVPHSATGIIDALTTQPLPAQHDREPSRTMDASLWPLGWPHEAPEEPLTVAEAHLTMQRHCSCQREKCPRKAAAYQTLVEAGRLTPDTGRTR